MKTSKLLGSLRIHWRNTSLNLQILIQLLNSCLLRINTCHHTRLDHQRPKILTLWYQLATNLCCCKVDMIWKLVECGLSNMRSDHQNYMNSLTKNNPKGTLLWTSIVYTIISICVSMWWLDSEKTHFLNTSPSNDTLIFTNTSCQIVPALPILGVNRHTTPSTTPFWWTWQMTHV